MFNCPVEQVERFQPTLTLCTNVHVVRVTLFELTCLKFRYKNLISWANRRTKAAQEKLDVHWVHPFPSFKRMHREWQRLGKAQKLETTIHNGKVGVRWGLPHFFNYVATQKELMESMDFPMINGEQLFVIIIRGDGFPCGSRPWVQIAIGFANHMEKARTLQYNWTLDVALTSEHDDEAMRVLFCATLQHIQTIIDSGYIQMNNVYYRARIMLGGDSPWLRLLLGLSPYYAIGSIYSFSTWCSRRERWMNTKVRRTTHLDGKFRALYDKGLDCTTAKGCTSKPMLRVDDRTRFIVMCILHLVIRLGDYLTHFIRVESVPHNWYDASDATNYNASPPSMVEVGGTISSGGRSKKSSMEEAPAAVAPPTTLPNAATSTSSMMRGVEQVCATSVQPVFNRVQPGS